MCFSAYFGHWVYFGLSSNPGQTALKDCSRSALFASAVIKHSLIPQKNLFKFENGKVYLFTKIPVVSEYLGKVCVN